MKRYRRGTRALAMALAVLMAGVSAVPAGAAPIGDGVAPTYDEAYYATLDYYGNLMEGSVVKSYALNGTSSFTDYGVYDEVVNLTDSTAASLTENSAAFQFVQTPEHFYFEGRTAQPFRELPWTITLRYTLNGVPARAEDLAGKTGVVEILLDIVPNPNASDYARYNYTLEAMALFNQDNILSLEAPGAQVQLVGNLRTVLLMALPGEERHFTIRVGSDDFSFGGMTILMVPATLAQLEEIAKLSQRKDDLEEDYRALSGSLDALLDAMSDIQSGLYSSASGLDELNAARGTVSAGKGLLYDDAGVLRGDLSGIADLLEPVEQRALALSQTISSSKAVLSGMADTTVSLRSQLEELEKALKGLESGAGDVRQVVQSLAGMKSSLRSLQRALGDTQINSGGSGSSTSMTATVSQVKSVHAVYESAGDDTAFITGMLQLSGKTQTTAENVLALQGIPTLEAFKQAQAAGLTGSATEADWRSAQELKALQGAVQSGMSFQQFCGKLPGVDEKTAKQMNDLWTVYSSGPVNGTYSAGQDAPAPSARESGAEEEPAEGDGDPAGLAGGLLSAAMLPGTGLLSAALAGSGIYLAASELPGGTGDPVPADAAPSGGESQTVGGAAVDLIVGGLDDAMSQASAKIDSIQSELNSTINRITRPTGRVVGELADLCDDVDDLVDLINSAEDLSAAVRQSSEKLRSILSDVEALQKILDEYEPTLQEGVANAGALSASAVTTIRDLEKLLSDAEALMKTSGSQLDSGTRQTLQGLAAALRQTAKAMAAVEDVRQAKSTVTDIVEDTWHEYTGDVNNLLLMDATARPVSLTDTRNPAPSSVQVLLRTQEIKAEEPALEAEQLAARESTTFWGRVAQMFIDFWKAITGIFR